MEFLRKIFTSRERLDSAARYLSESKSKARAGVKEVPSSTLTSRKGSGLGSWEAGLVGCFSPMKSHPPIKSREHVPGHAINLYETQLHRGFLY